MLLSHAALTKRQRSIVRSMKLAPATGSDHLAATTLPLIDHKKTTVGFLRVIDEQLSVDQETIRALTAWRRRFRRYFLTDFEPTPERTQKWLCESVLADDTRVFFLILDDAGRLVGNFGIRNISGNEAELDNLIRGERGGNPRLMFYAMVGLSAWAYISLGVDSVFLRVLSTNHRAISLNRSIGFSETRSQRLLRVRNGSHRNLVVADGANDDREVGSLDPRPNSPAPELIEMRIDKFTFFAKHPWLVP